MHGLGNDFVVVEAKDIPSQADCARLAAFLSNRNFGVGSDGLIIIEPPSDPSRFDIQFTFFNSDGSRAEMCGNGIRCFARYVNHHGIISKPAFRVETLAGLIQPQVHADGLVTVNMGPPILAADHIPFTGSPGASQVQHFPLQVLGQTVPVSLVSMGNPHCIIFQDDLSQPLSPADFGPAIETHPLFPAKTNVEFLEILDSKTIRVTVWERGCGFTLACGTGACASAVAAALCGKTEHSVEVHLPGGVLQIQWDREHSNDVLMTGPATFVFEGDILIPEGNF